MYSSVTEMQRQIHLGPLSFKPGLLLFLFLFIVLCLFSTSCANEDVELEQSYDEPLETVRVVYVDWVSEIASAHIVKAVIEDRLGYNCELLSVTAISMWESVAAGDQDAMVGAWLPTLQEHYYENVKDDVINLGPNLEGVEMGLVVPAHVEIGSIEELNEHFEAFEGKIIGIDPEAGLMENTVQAIDRYDLEYELVSGSDLTMTSALDIAFDEERWIVVTGWSPHWKFARWDLKYLEDPKSVYGDSEYIGTIVRKGLEHDMPDVYKFFENFYWTPGDMEQVMLWFSEEGMSAEEAAKRWVDEHPEVVDEWFVQ